MAATPYDLYMLKASTVITLSVYALSVVGFWKAPDCSIDFDEFLVNLLEMSNT
jgi:hypothetical protein